ncbi:hypothetical protein PIB30_082346, partial [Stylosanthes scabra]|nr:hypothetical protein [Stylosanthes scabra]
MHPPRDSKTCMKMEEVDQVKTAPPNKGPKKKSKEEKGNQDSVKFQQLQKDPNVPYPSVIVGSKNKAYMITEGVGN